MKKVAKLVLVHLCTRVIIHENATEEEIIKKAKEQIKGNIDTDFGDNVESIEDDEECPYDENSDANK